MSQISQAQHNIHLTRPSAYLYASTCTYICMRIHRNVHINIYIREHTRTSKYTCAHRSAFTYGRTSTHTHIRTRVYKYPNACCYTYTYTYAYTFRGFHGLLGSCCKRRLSHTLKHQLMYKRRSVQGFRTSQCNAL